MNTNTKGNIALGKAIEYFTMCGYCVSIPLNDSQCYDLIVDTDDGLKTVQVKYTSEQRNDNCYICTLQTTSGTSRKKMYSIVEKNIDYLFCYCKIGWKFLIPIKDIKTTKTISLFKNNVKNAKLDTSKYYID